MENGGAAFPFVHLLDQIYGVKEAAKHVVVCHGCFSQLSSSLGKIGLLIPDVMEAARLDNSHVHSIVHPLTTELKNAKELVAHCTTKSKFYLLLSSHGYARRIHSILSSLASIMLDLTADHMDIPLKTKNTIKLLCRDMQAMEIRVSAEEDDLVKLVELVVRNHYTDSKHSNEVLYKLATMAGISMERSSLRREFDELRQEKELIAQDKDDAEVLQLNQIISVLNSADALGSATVREQLYREQRQGVDNNFLPPLQTFYCPITQEVMENPVEIESGQTFEMAAIQKWFAEGHRVCPITKMELSNLSLKPNRLLQQSIEEWKDRNTIMKVATMVSRLNSGDESSLSEALLELQAICEEKSIHKYWVAAEGLIPVLVSLLGSSKRELKKKILATLTAVVSDNSENRVKACDAGAAEHAVRSLARDLGEARQAVTLLSELCKEESICRKVSKVQGCILLMVTLANSDNMMAATHAKELLSLFAKDDENVVHMAKVNYFGPLVECLHKGSLSTKIFMANTLADLPLPDQSKALLVQEGVISFLVRLASENNLEAKAASLGAFRNLSSSCENGVAMIKDGVMNPVLEVLLTVKSVAVPIRENAAATFANLAMCCESNVINRLWGTQRDVDEVLLQLMSLLNLTGPNIQSHILKALECICKSSTSLGLRERLRERESIQFLAHFMNDKDSTVRLYALKFLFTLTKDGGADTLVEELSPDSFDSMVGLFSLDSLEEEKIAAMGILGNLPLNNRKVTERMLEVGVLPSIVSILDKYSSAQFGRTSPMLVENAMWTLIRFTLQTDVELQLHTARHGIIPILVNLLSVGTPLIKCRAAMSLQQFSESTIKLSIPVKKPKGLCCFSPLPDAGCVLHGGLCSVEDTFCLIESNAVTPLIQALDDNDDDLDEAVLSCLVTLVSGDLWVKGSDIIAEANGVKQIIKKLTSENAGVQEKALSVLDKILMKEDYKVKFGSVAQMPLVSLAQAGTAQTRPLAAKLLAHLNILHDQSSYF